MHLDIRKLEKKIKCERGNAAVEFGLILPVVLALLLGIMDYGYVYYVQLTLTNAAREGARVGATRPDTGTAMANAVTAAQQYLSSAGIETTPQASMTTVQSDQAVHVDITLSPFDPLIGFVPTPDSLNASATMRWEGAL